MKKRIVVFGIVLSMVFTMAAPAYGASGFTDVAGHEDEAVIEKWCDYGIIQGYEGSFRPDEVVTESELDIMLDRLMGREVSPWIKSAGLTYDKALSMLTSDFVNYQYAGNESGQMTRADAVSYLERLVGPVETVYSHDFISSLSGGFSDTIEKYAAEQNWTPAEFQEVCELPATSMSAVQLAGITAVRDKQLVPTADTLVQKVVTEYDVKNYLNGSYQAPRGFISICADVKQYETIEDCYYGLRLDYAGTYFNPDDSCYGVIRFTADNSKDAVIPKSPVAGGTVKDPFPFGGAGFTTGTNGRMGSPEWTLPGAADIGDGGAQLLLIMQDGREELRGIYCENAGRFVNIKITENNFN